MRALILPLIPLALASCTGQPDARGAREGGRFDIRVSPLTLEAPDDVVYTLRLYNAEPALVWEAAALSSSRYGDGHGALTYVGACDASASGNPHTLEITLDALLDATGAPIDTATWQNPAPPGAPLRLDDLVCRPDADVLVTLDLTILRDARQGFFDVAVSFEDIFCSAKLDCVDDQGEPLRLLHDPTTGERSTTAVLGFACTSGRAGDGSPEPTWLHLDDVVVSCQGVPDIVIEPNAPVGQRGPRGPGLEIFQTAIYRGAESLPGWEKCYWNLALGVDLEAARGCRLRARGTASHDDWRERAGASPPATVWAYVDWDVPLTGDGAFACGQEPLNGGTGRVTTRFTAPDGAVFAHPWRCGDDEIDDDAIACDGAFPGGLPIAAWREGGGVRVSIGGVRTALAHPLPDGYFLEPATSCCANECCATP